MGKEVELRKQLTQLIMKTSANVRELAEKHPNAVYEIAGGACSYTSGDVVDRKTKHILGSGCIVGQALLKERPDLEPMISELDAAGSLEVYDLFDNIADYGFADEIDPNAAVDIEDVPELSLEMISWMQSVQTLQDEGHTWGEALSRADTAQCLE